MQGRKANRKNPHSRLFAGSLESLFGSRSSELAERAGFPPQHAGTRHHAHAVTQAYRRPRPAHAGGLRVVRAPGLPHAAVAISRPRLLPAAPSDSARSVPARRDGSGNHRRASSRLSKAPARGHAGPPVPPVGQLARLLRQVGQVSPAGHVSNLSVAFLFDAARTRSSSFRPARSCPTFMRRRLPVPANER